MPDNIKESLLSQAYLLSPLDFDENPLEQILASIKEKLESNGIRYFVSERTIPFIAMLMILTVHLTGKRTVHRAL
jgi:hypothetical protein